VYVFDCLVLLRKFIRIKHVIALSIALRCAAYVALAILRALLSSDNRLRTSVFSVMLDYRLIVKMLLICTYHYVTYYYLLKEMKNCLLLNFGKHQLWQKS
jgi:hypothetical protein